MKQTAMDWLFSKLWDIERDKFEWQSILKKAKEMEKEQIILAHGKQLKKTQTAGNYEYWLTGQQYYNETYK
jgi:thioredoxin reductase